MLPAFPKTVRTCQARYAVPALQKRVRTCQARYAVPALPITHKETHIMKHRTFTLAAILALILAWVLLIIACDQDRETGALPPDEANQFADPGEMSFAVGDTNFTNVVASGDISAGDDITVGDDLTVGDALAIPGNLSSSTGAITITDNLMVDGQANVAQLTVQGHSTQSDYLMVLEQSDGTDKFTCDNAGNIVVQGTSYLNGALYDTNSTLTVNDDLLIDGQADAVQLTVQEYVTPTGAAFVIEDSGGTDVIAMQVAEQAAQSWDFIDITDGLPILDGSDTIIGIDMNLTGANHTGSSNVIYGIDLDLTTADAQAEEVAIELTDTDWDTGIKSVLDLEHILLPSVDSATVITTTDGALWTVGATEVWYIDRVFCNVTTNFDCTGDDCTIEIGLTGGDIDGFLDLDDAELQTTDAEIAGLTAGWQGFGSTDTRGAFFAAGGGVILGNDTVDIKIEDNSDQSNPTAGAATCYIVYTRLQ